MEALQVGSFTQRIQSEEKRGSSLVYTTIEWWMGKEMAPANEPEKNGEKNGNQGKWNSVNSVRSVFEEVHSVKDV